MRFLNKIYTHISEKRLDTVESELNQFVDVAIKDVYLNKRSKF